MTQIQEFYFEVTIHWSQTDCDYYVVKAKNKEECEKIVNGRFRIPNSHLPLISIGSNRYKLLTHE
jgi:putative N-acetylmannosamine-6-phosphate epimerase